MRDPFFIDLYRFAPQQVVWRDVTNLPAELRMEEFRQARQRFEGNTGIPAVGDGRAHLRRGRRGHRDHNLRDRSPLARQPRNNAGGVTPEAEYRDAGERTPLLTFVVVDKTEYLGLEFYVRPD